MLETIDLNVSLGKKEYKKAMDQISPRLAQLQRDCKEAGIPVVILFEGLDAAGKGTLINQLIEPMDPRGFHVVTTQKETEEERMHPFLWRFWEHLPPVGRMTIFDRSWYRRVQAERFEGDLSPERLGYSFEEIRTFEELLFDGGTVIIKFFLIISAKEQAKRLKKLQNNPTTAWRVGETELSHNRGYEEYLSICQEMIEQTESEFAPWTIIEATDNAYARVKIMSQVIHVLENALKIRTATVNIETTPSTQPEIPVPGNFILSGVDLSKSYSKDEYKKRLKDLQTKIFDLQNVMYRKRIPVILAFEGWDAGGKGGAIKRLTQNLDPRGYEVNPVASPNDIEKSHHYLWRFWKKMPKDGHIAIFDRSWYGRVLVERIEGFCTEREWRRAYKELNEMEANLSNHGAIVIKFWMQIDKEEQERRFKERMENPEKQWKITDEDWRNREKWEQYEIAADEMLRRTSTSYAPWVIVEANNKYYARIKVLETVVAAMEKKLL